MRSPSGASAKLILKALGRELDLVANVALFLEYEAVSTRQEHLLAAKVTRAEMERVLDDLARVIHPVERDVSWRPQLTDADDEMVLEAAINGRAAAIVTFELSTFQAAARRFCISIMTPGQMWAMLKA